MLDRMTIDLRALDSYDLDTLKPPKRTTPPKLAPMTGAKATIVHGAVAAAAPHVKAAKAILDVIDFMKTNIDIKYPQRWAVGVKDWMFNGGAAPDVTFATSLGGQEYAFLGGDFGAGLYGGQSPGEFGAFASTSGMLTTNIGVGGYLQQTLIFGPPSMMGGWGASIGVGVATPMIGPAVSISASLLISTSPPIRIYGVAMSMGASIDLFPLPGSITAVAGYTQQWPIFRAT